MTRFEDGGLFHPNLDPDRIVASLELLSRRIFERFPQSGLYQVSCKVVQVGREARGRAEWIARPILVLRLSTGLLVLVLVAGALWSFATFALPRETPHPVEFVTFLEAGINDVLLIGAGIFFLVSSEARIKRRRSLDALHGLRVLAHVIDMHQLHKDPERVLQRGELTPSTPRIEMSSFELSRYLDYCSELLSLTGKIAALYVQSFPDPVVANAVSEVEQLTTGISRKIWQKLMILHSLDEHGRGRRMELAP